MSFHRAPQEPADVTRIEPALTTDQVESIEVNLHGVAGGILRRKLLPVLRRKRETVQRRLLTRKQQGASCRGPPFSAAVQQAIKSCLTNAHCSDCSADLMSILARCPWEMVWGTLAPLLTPVSFRTGEVMQFPNTPAEASLTFFILQGTVVSIATRDVRLTTTQYYLRRLQPSGFDRASFDPRKTAQSTLGGMATYQGPFVCGLGNALQFSPQDDACLFAGPLEHAMPGVTDVLSIPNRDVQEWLYGLATAASNPTVSASCLQPQIPSTAFEPTSRFCRQQSIGFLPEARASMSAIRRRQSSITGGFSKDVSPIATRQPSAVGRGFRRGVDDEDERNKLYRSTTAADAAVVKQCRLQLQALLLSSRAHCLVTTFPLSEAMLKLSWLFQCLPPHALADVLKNLKPLSVTPGTKLAVAGESNRRWLFLRRGRCVIFPNAEVVDSSPAESDGVGGSTKHAPQKRRSTFSASGVPVSLEAGCSIGELSLIFEEPRSHTIEAATMCDLWVLDQQSFSDILMCDESLRSTCQRKGAVLRAKWLAAQRRAPALLEMLRTCPLFRDCWSEVLYTMLLDAIEPMVLPQRTLITSAAAFADRLLIVVKGSASSQRGDVPLTFGPGSIIGGACFVRHRWPLAIATTSIVDCWTLSAAQLKFIAHRLDLIQTLSHWEPENERGKYLTKVQEMYPGGRLFPPETMALLRRSVQLAEKELIPVLPSTASGLRQKGERRTSFAAHFRVVSMHELEDLCVKYPDSFNMNDLLFRTSYGNRQDHLRAQFLASTKRVVDGAISSDSLEDASIHHKTKSTKADGTSSNVGGSQREKDSAAITVANARSMRRRQRRRAFERVARRQIRLLVGETLSSSSRSSSSDVPLSDGSPEENKLEKFKAHRRTHKHHGALSGVLSHVDDGTVMNAAQLDADQIVMRRVLREQRRKERQGLSSANALMFNPAFVFNGQRALSTGGGSIFLSHTMSSHSIAFSEDERSGSVVGDSDAAGSMVLSNRNPLEKMALPSGAQEWETELKAIFAAGDDVIPAFRDMSRILKMRSKKLRQRIKAKAPASSIGAQPNEADAAARAKRAKVLDSLFAPVDDTQLHQCVHTTDPEVNVGFQEHLHLRHVLSVSSAQRLPFIIGTDAKHRPGNNGSDELEDTPAMERTKMLLQLFRSGYAGRTKSVNSTDRTGSDAAPGSGGEDDQRRRTRGLSSALLSTGGQAEGASPRLVDVSTSSGGGIRIIDDCESGAPAARTSPQTITLSIPDMTSNGAAHSDMSSPMRRKSTLGPTRRSVDAGAVSPLVYNPQQFPTKALFFEHVARELMQRITTDPVVSMECLQDRLQCGGWADVSSNTSSSVIPSDFGPFMEYIKLKYAAQQAAHESSRRASSFVSSGSNLGRHASSRSTPTPSAPGTPTGAASLSNSTCVSPKCLPSELSAPPVIDGDVDSASPRVLTPETPHSCSSPALSDLGWTEWDRYLSEGDDDQRPQSSTCDVPRSASAVILTSSSKNQHRKSFVRRTGQSLMVAPTLSLASSASSLSGSAAEDNGAARRAGAQEDATVPTVTTNGTVRFESQTGRTSPDEGDAIAALLLKADMIRRGEGRSELEELFVAHDLGDNGGTSFELWIDAVGPISIGGPHGESDADVSAEVLAARKALRFVGRARAAGSRPASYADGTDRETDERFDEMLSDERRTLSNMSSSGKHPRHNGVGVASHNMGGAGGGGGGSAFPDVKETNRIIKNMERLADNLSLGVVAAKTTVTVASQFDVDRVSHSERLELKAAAEDMRYATSQLENAVAAAHHSRAGKAMPSSLVADGGDQHADAQRFHTSQRHWVMPWFLQREAGHDYLAEALAEVVPVSYKTKVGDSDDDDDADDEKDRGGEPAREQVVLVGSRQFSLHPRPLSKALPPRWSGLDAASDDEGRGTTKISQLLSYAAFADAGSISQSDGATCPGAPPTNDADAAKEVGGESPESQNVLSVATSITSPLPQRQVLRRRKVRSFLKSTLAIPSASDASTMALCTSSSMSCNAALVRQSHEERMVRLCRDVRRRYQNTTTVQSSDVLSQLPVLPLTPNMAIMQLPHSTVGPRQPEHRRKLTMQWRSLQIPV